MVRSQLCQFGSETAGAHPDGPSQRNAATKYGAALATEAQYSRHLDEIVDTAAADSFPASDPPSFAGGLGAVELFTTQQGDCPDDAEGGTS